MRALAWCIAIAILLAPVPGPAFTYFEEGPVRNWALLPIVLVMGILLLIVGVLDEREKRR